MKIYLLTSNKYTKNICPINVHFLNKYWPNQNITIVGYEDVLELKNLPNNVSIECLGTQEDYGATWTNALIPFFKQIEEEYFVLIFDDHILMNNVDESKIYELEKYLINKKAQKAMIGGGIDLRYATKFQQDQNVLVFDQYVDYRTSLHPAIWTKDYFLRYLKPNMTSWDFEIRNHNKSRGDGANILNYNYSYPDEPHLFSYLELYTKGTLNLKDAVVQTEQKSRKFFNDEDLKYIWERTK